MGNIEQRQAIVTALLRDYAEERTGKNGIEYKVLIDTENHQYQLSRMYWDMSRELVMQIIFHFEIKPDGKVWILANNTDLPIAKELMKLGLTHQDIVLGFHPAELRAFSDYAVA